MTSLGVANNPFTPPRLTFAGIALQAGTEYWLLARPTLLTSNTFAAWGPSDQGGGLFVSAEFDTNAWRNANSNPEGAFDLVGSLTTPEPGSCVLLGLGLTACAAFRKRLASV